MKIENQQLHDAQKSVPRSIKRRQIDLQSVSTFVFFHLQASSRKMNYQVLLLLIGALVVLSAAKDLRIKGARPAKATEFPSMAAISDKEGFVGHGIILSKRVIMAPAST